MRVELKNLKKESYFKVREVDYSSAGMISCYFVFIAVFFIGLAGLLSNVSLDYYQYFVSSMFILGSVIFLSLILFLNYFTSPVYYYKK